jgi:hypothetical protein
LKFQILGRNLEKNCHIPNVFQSFISKLVERQAASVSKQADGREDRLQTRQEEWD